MKHLKQEFKEWYRKFRKALDVKQEVKRRGGREPVNESRKRRQEEIRWIKEDVIKDLQNGWIIGDFRIREEHTAILSSRPFSIPIEELIKIKKEYRSF